VRQALCGGRSFVALARRVESTTPSGLLPRVLDRQRDRLAVDLDGLAELADGFPLFPSVGVSVLDAEVGLPRAGPDAETEAALLFVPEFRLVALADGSIDHSLRQLHSHR
jgi:hypothetical protein